MLVFTIKRKVTLRKPNYSTNVAVLMFKTNELRDVLCKTWTDFAHRLFTSQFLREFKIWESEINPYSVLSLFTCSNRIEAAYFKNNAERLVNGENRRWKQKSHSLFIFPHSIKGLWNELSLHSSQSSGRNGVAHYTSSRSEMRLGRRKVAEQNILI